MRAISVEIMKGKFGDCSNGGISSRYSEILIVCDTGYIEIDENNPPENLCKIVERNLFGEVYKHIEPVARPTGVGWMYGGCVCCTSDSRFDSRYPLKLHDRQESQELYDSNFND